MIFLEDLMNQPDFSKALDAVFKGATRLEKWSGKRSISV